MTPGGADEGAELRGIFPIVYTPFDPAGDVVEADLRRLVDHLIAAGAHGLAAVGGSSECHKLTEEERTRLAELVMDQAAGRVPVIVGTSATNTRTAARLCEHAERIGARAAFLTPPLFGPPDARAIRAHYREVARAVGIPLMIQHHLIPLPVPLMVELSEELPTIRYVKEEAPLVSGHAISELLRLSGGRLRVFSAGVYLLDELARGAVGAIPGSVCVADLARAYDLHAAGDAEGARRAFQHAVPLLYARLPGPILWAKEVLRRQGIFGHAVLREPAGQLLDEQDGRELTAVLEAMGPPY